jgi:predicted RNase H-like nuclease
VFTQSTINGDVTTGYCVIGHCESQRRFC